MLRRLRRLRYSIVPAGLVCVVLTTCARSRYAVMDPFSDQRLNLQEPHPVLVIDVNHMLAFESEQSRSVIIAAVIQRTPRVLSHVLAFENRWHDTRGDCSPMFCGLPLAGERMTRHLTHGVVGKPIRIPQLRTCGCLSVLNDRVVLDYPQLRGKGQ